MKLLHAQRFKGAEIPLNRVQYNELLEKLKAFFADKCTVRVAELPRDAAPAAAASPSGTGASGTLVLIIILVVAMAAAVGVTWFMTHRPQ